MISPASHVLHTGKLVLPGHGGTLARVINASSSQEGHFLFTEQAQKLRAQITYTAGPLRVPAGSAPAASPHGLDPARVPQALPLVLPEVNHVCHWGGSLFVDETKFNRSAFA